MIQTTLTLFGASAVIASAVIFVCRPVLIAALDAMRSAELPFGRMLIIGLWAFIVTVTLLWVVASAAVTMHSQKEARFPSREAAGTWNPRWADRVLC